MSISRSDKKLRLFLSQSFPLASLLRHLSDLLFTFQEIPHCISRCPDRSDCILQLHVGARELVTPVFDLIRFIRIDSVIGVRASLGFFVSHGFSPCQSVAVDR